MDINEAIRKTVTEASATAPVNLKKLSKAMDLSKDQEIILFDYFRNNGKITTTTKR